MREGSRAVLAVAGAAVLWSSGGVVSQAAPPAPLARGGGGPTRAAGAASGVFFALTIVLLRRDARGGRNDAVPSTTLGNLIAAALTMPFLLKASITPAGMGVLLYLGIVQLGVAYLLFAYGVRRVPAAEASLISTLEPILNPLWVFIGYQETPGPWALAGGAIVITAVVLRTLADRASTPP